MNDWLKLPTWKYIWLTIALLVLLLVILLWPIKDDTIEEVTIPITHKSQSSIRISVDWLAAMFETADGKRYAIGFKKIASDDTVSTVGDVVYIELEAKTK